MNDRDRWRALGPAVHCMAFDFYEAQDNMQKLETHLSLPLHTTGTCNAVAFWFELHLDEERTLCTSPDAVKVLQIFSLYGLKRSRHGGGRTVGGNLGGFGGLDVGTPGVLGGWMCGGQCGECMSACAHVCGMRYA